MKRNIYKKRGEKTDENRRLKKTGKEDDVTKIKNRKKERMDIMKISSVIKIKRHTGKKREKGR